MKRRIARILRRTATRLDPIAAAPIYGQTYASSSSGADVKIIYR